MRFARKVDFMKNNLNLEYSVIQDIPYAAQSDAQKLDLYLPANSTLDYPVIVWIHPGGFFDGDKAGHSNNDPLSETNMKQLISPMLMRTYAVVSINYRLSHESLFPNVIFDVKAAIRWVKANAEKYHFNPEKVAAWGSSAGGYLAAFLATSGGVKDLEDLSMGNSGISSRITAGVDWYGPTNFLKMDSQHLLLGQKPINSNIASPESKLMGAQITFIPEKCITASPITYIKPDHAPVYIQHGKSDEIVPYLQSVDMFEQLQASGGKAEVILELVENVGHAHPSFFTSENINKILDFLDRYMK